MPHLTLDNARADVQNILSWYRDLDATATTKSPSIGHTSPSTNTEARLPFGLDASTDTIDDGPTGIRTAYGATEYLRVLASWLHTSGHPATLPDQARVGAWIQSMLDTPYPWEAWDDWDSWAEDLRTARRVIAHRTGHAMEAAGTCPQCAGTLTRRPGTRGDDDEAGYCRDCDQTYTGAEWNFYWQQTMRAVTDPTVFVSRADLLAIWDGIISSDNLKKYVHRHQIIKHEDGTYRLAAVNLWLADYIDLR